jgi:prenyltransferase beta subunit
MDVIAETIKTLPEPAKMNPGEGTLPFDAYTLYYVGQALYQVNGSYWTESYPKLRDMLVKSQVKDAKKPAEHGCWRDRGIKGGGHVGGKQGELYATSVACFVIAIPNRYLPILQEGKIESLKNRITRQ